MKATLDLTKIGEHIDKIIVPNGCDWANVHISLAKETVREYMYGMKVTELEKDKYEVETDNVSNFNDLMLQYEVETSLDGQIESFLDRTLFMLDDWFEDDWNNEFADKSHDVIYDYINVNELEKVSPNNYSIVKQWIADKIEDGY